MPRKEDIEQFTQVLNSLGNEPAIRAARSETIDEVPGELDSLDLGPESGDTETGPPAESEGTFESLSALPDEDTAAQSGGAVSGEEPLEQEAAGGPAAAGPVDEGLDFASLFGEEAAPEGIEELEKPVPPPLQAEEDAFSLPEGEAGRLEADLSQLETLPDEEALGEPGSAPEPSPPGAEQAGEAESFELPDLSDLSFPETPESPAAAAAAEEPPPPPEEPPPSPEEPPPEEPALDQAGMAGFDLDTLTIPEQGAGSEADQLPSEMPAEVPGLAEESAPAAGGELVSLGEERLEDLNLEQFGLPQSAEEFGAAGTAAAPKAPPAPPRPRPTERRLPRPQPRPAAAPPEPGLGEGEIELTPEQFARLKKSLQFLPRNLKIIVQDLIGEGTATGADLTALINLLLQGATVQEIAALAGRISGKRIRIPSGYEKRTGAAFEAEQRTFAYAFRENFLPLLRVLFITVLAGGLFGFLGYNYVYRPLFAYANYRAGYTQIINDRYALANERFARATSVWPLKGWYYRYAEAFAAKRQYGLAEKKYEELLAAYPGDQRGVLDFARFESIQLSDFEKADSLLQQYIDRHLNDYDALLASGDNDLLWADRDRSKFEAARLAYATLIDKYGARNELLFRMLRFFIRTDNGVEVERLRAFYATRRDVRIDAQVYAELGGYLVDHRRLDYVQDVLFRADRTQPGLYEVHYNLARYYRLLQNSTDEKKALDATVLLLERTRSSDPITRRRLTVEIDTHTRLGEFHYRAKEYIPAERELLTAIHIVENNQKNKLIGQDRLYGRPYADLGDLYYYVQGDLQTAAVQFQNAIANLYTDPLLTYKIGHVQYSQKDYKSALDTFTSAEDASAYPSGNEALAPVTDSAAPALSGQPPQNLLYALGDTFYLRGDYFAAQGYFLRLLDRLQSRRAALGPLHPEDRLEDRALLELLERVNNNLGVTMFRLAERTGDQNKRSEALVYLSSATEIAASLARSPDTVKRSEDRSLPSLNMRGILYPVTRFVLQIFSVLPKDFEASTW